MQKEIFYIGEIGINANGHVGIAKDLICMAKRCGCDAVKFQKRDIDIVYDEAFLSSERESPWGTTQRDQKEGLEFSEKDYDEIDQFCKEKEIEWFASAWDLNSFKFLKKYDCNYNKIASAMLTDLNFVEEVAKERKLTFISTGMSTFETISFAIRKFVEYDCPFILMHCVSLYPCPEAKCNISVIKSLRDVYRCHVGYSGHESGILPSIIAVAMGAVAIERHITLDKTMYGSDQFASLEEDEFKNMVHEIERVQAIKGDGKKRFCCEEKMIAKKLRYFEKEV